MRNKIHQIFPFLTDNQTDILFVQETWIRKCDGAILKEIKEYGFDILSYRKPCQLDWGRGVATVFKHNLKIKLIKLSLYQSFEYITCKIISDDGPVCVVNMYRPEYTPKNPFTVRHFLEEFKTFLEELLLLPYPVIILGDLNLHVELQSESNEHLTNTQIIKRNDAKAFLSLLSDFDFCQLVNEHGGTLDLLIAVGPNQLFFGNNLN